MSVREPWFAVLCGPDAFWRVWRSRWRLRRDAERYVEAVEREPGDIFCDYGRQAECPVHGDVDHRIKRGAMGRRPANSHSTGGTAATKETT